jgi:RNA polymerase sigma-70 factor (ECF subfamily)
MPDAERYDGERQLVPWPRTRSAVEALPRAARPEPPDAALDDAALVAAARANPEAFTLLYERHARQIHRYCYLKLGSRDAAEDATSQVFLEAMSDLGSFRGSGHGAFGGWLFRIAQHTVTDMQRRNQWAPRVRGSAPHEAAEPIDPDDMPEEIAVGRSGLDAIRTAVRTLPPEQRQVIELQLAGLSTREIARALGRSANAVRIARFRAFGRLRPLLEPSFPELVQGYAAEGDAR